MTMKDSYHSWLHNATNRLQTHLSLLFVITGVVITGIAAAVEPLVVAANVPVVLQSREVWGPDIVRTNKHLGDLLEEGEGGHRLDREPVAGALHLVGLVDVSEVPDVLRRLRLGVLIDDDVEVLGDSHGPGLSPLLERHVPTPEAAAVSEGRQGLHDELSEL